MATRIATTDDAPRIAELLGELRSSPVDPRSILSQLEQRFDGTDNAVILVLSESGSAVGMALVNLVYKLPNIECRFDEVIVNGRVRGEGYGRILIEACEEWAWHHGADTIGFTSRKTREAANMLYQKAGFEIRDTNAYIKYKAAR